MAEAEKNKSIMNHAVFRGTIVSIRGENGNGTIVLACPMITSMHRQGKIENGARVNYPALSFNKNTKTQNILTEFKQGNRVYVKAYLQTYVHMDDFGEAHEMVNIYIDEIAQEYSKMMSMFGKNGRTFPESINEVYLSCTLAGITKHTNTILEFRLDLSDKRKNLMDAIYYRASAGIANGMTIGDSVDILAMIQTVNTKENKKVRNYQELVILDISK